MKNINKLWPLLVGILVLMTNSMNGQSVGVNIASPTVELDVRTTIPEDAANINIANSNNSHFFEII